MKEQEGPAYREPVAGSQTLTLEVRCTIMEYKSEIFIEQFPIVKCFLYHLVYYRGLSNVYNKFQLKSEFWTHTIDAHLLQAAIHWCMVFGADGCNPTHWKNLSADDSAELIRSFRQCLFNKTGINSGEWEKYWKEMTSFRNQYAAHRELNYKNPVPDFSIALNISHYYDNWIRKVIEPDVFDEPLLTETEENLKKAVAPLIDQLLKITKEYNKDTEQAA